MAVSKTQSIKTVLSGFSKEKLIDLVCEMNKSCRDANKFLSARFYPEKLNEILEDTKKNIQKEFFPTRGYGRANLTNVKKAISSYVKITGDPLAESELLLFFVEQGIKFTNKYGDIHEDFYVSVETAFRKAIEIQISLGNTEICKKVCRKLIKLNKMDGWGFADSLREIFEDNFN